MFFGCISYDGPVYFIHVDGNINAERYQEIIQYILDWPSKSPDLNVIGRVWAAMRNRIEYRPLMSLADIEKRVPELWKEVVTPEFCRSLYNSIPNLVARCKKNHGYRVRTSQKSAKTKDGTPKDFPPDLRDMIT